jgi:hypothetical protein
LLVKTLWEQKCDHRPLLDLNAHRFHPLSVTSNTPLDHIRYNLSLISAPYNNHLANILAQKRGYLNVTKTSLISFLVGHYPSVDVRHALDNQKTAPVPHIDDNESYQELRKFLSGDIDSITAHSPSISRPFLTKPMNGPMIHLQNRLWRVFYTGISASQQINSTDCFSCSIRCWICIGNWYVNLGRDLILLIVVVFMPIWR